MQMSRDVPRNRRAALNEQMQDRNPCKTCTVHKILTRTAQYRTVQDSSPLPTPPISTSTYPNRSTNLSQSTNQSHLPSFHPVLHLSSQNRQSNSFFPNFRLTALCASHIHVPNSWRPDSRGWLRPPGSFIHARKSSAHTQQGYRRAKSVRKLRMSSCCWGVAVAGYAAVSECRKVQVERPRASTSGGQSAGIGSVEGLAVLVAAAPAAVAAEACLVRAFQDATEVQRRHLFLFLWIRSV